MSVNTRKARQRLRQAKKSSVELRFARTFEDFEDAWLNFLLHAKGVYEQLGVACKGNAKAMQWLGAKKSERRNDQLLQYVYQSRNYAEHDPGSGARLNPGYLAIGKNLPGASSSIRFDGNLTTGLKVTSLDGLPIALEQKADSVDLLPVTARGGVVYHPPEVHLGEPIKEQTPPVIADLCNNYLAALIEEAETKFS